jgi:hypothetical protein
VSGSHPGRVCVWGGGGHLVSAEDLVEEQDFDQPPHVPQPAFDQEARIRVI